MRLFVVTFCLEMDFYIISHSLSFLAKYECLVVSREKRFI
jgi:hypothetical protein